MRISQCSSPKLCKIGPLKNRTNGFIMTFSVQTLSIFDFLRFFYKSIWKCPPYFNKFPTWMVDVWNLTDWKWPVVSKISSYDSSRLRDLRVPVKPIRAVGSTSKNFYSLAYAKKNKSLLSQNVVRMYWNVRIWKNILVHICKGVLLKLNYFDFKTKIEHSLILL